MKAPNSCGIRRTRLAAGDLCAGSGNPQKDRPVVTYVKGPPRMNSVKQLQSVVKIFKKFRNKKDWLVKVFCWRIVCVPIGVAPQCNPSCSGWSPFTTFCLVLFVVYALFADITSFRIMLPILEDSRENEIVWIFYEKIQSLLVYYQIYVG